MSKEVGIFCCFLPPILLDRKSRQVNSKGESIQQYGKGAEGKWSCKEGAGHVSSLPRFVRTMAAITYHNQVWGTKLIPFELVPSGLDHFSLDH